MATLSGSAVRFGLALTLVALSACAPKLVVGEFSCNGGVDAGVPDKTAAVATPWSTSFEGKDCDYQLAAGYCYAFSGASFEAVTSPVHSGRYAMAFHADSNDAGSEAQARCVRQGVLPQAAYYGAWYYVPSLVAIDTDQVWNLFHFQSGDTTTQNGMWDVSLVNDKNQDDVELVAFNFLKGTTYPAQRVPIPLGSWFHLELYLKRASDMTGEAALYQDGEQIFDVTNVVSDNSASTFQQWYVGNYTSGLVSTDNTVYVDDVTISETR